MRRNFYEVFREIDEKSLQNGIEIRWAGRTSHLPNFEMSRYHQRFLMLYVYDGVCLLDDDGEERELGAGHLILFQPNEYQHYKANNKKMLHYYGLAFSGDFLERILEGTPLVSRRVHYISTQNKLMVMMQDLISEMLVYPKDHNEIIWGSFLRIIGEINVCIRQVDYAKSDNYLQEQRLQKSEQHIRLHYNEHLTIQEIADISGYSVSWFENLFRKQYQMSPINYQIKQRISKAKDMIRTNILNISEISFAVGFNDPLYFSKVFKKHVGVSPKQYRNMHVIKK